METDTKLSGVILSDPASLVDTARLLVMLGHKMIPVSVFDGRVAHAIIIYDYDGKDAVFHYRDPWGKGSFLERENNAAGVAAKPHPTQRRIWLLSFVEMERILYWIILPESTILATFRLCTLTSGPPERLVATYRAIHTTDPESNEVAPHWLEDAARYMITAQNLDAALALLATRAALYPTLMNVTWIEDLKRVGVADPEGRIRSLAVPTAAPPQRVRSLQLLNSAKEHDFFIWFNLEQTASEGSTLLFRPKGEKFRSLVEVKLSIAADGSITSRELALAGDFISDPLSGIFARDFIKSFLGFSVDSSELAEIKELIDELWTFERRRVSIPGARRMGASVPAMPSLAYLTYVGVHPAYEQTLPASTLEMRNVRQQGGRNLVITVTNR